MSGRNRLITCSPPRDDKDVAQHLFSFYHAPWITFRTSSRRPPTSSGMHTTVRDSSQVLTDWLGKASGQQRKSSMARRKAKRTGEEDLMNTGGCSGKIQVSPTFCVHAPSQLS